MCGIVGFISKNSKCQSFIVEALTRLEYRGYDSVGFACLDPQENIIKHSKVSGKNGNISSLKDSFINSPIDGFLGLGHTRWSTHGSSSIVNAHPHFDCHKNVSLVHNGIIENYHELGKELLKHNHILVSQTDSEMIAHIIEDLIKTEDSLLKVSISLVNKLEGAYALGCLISRYPDSLLFVRKRSPLCIGIDSKKSDTIFIASDTLAFSGYVDKVLYMPESSFAIIKNNSIEIYNFDGEKLDSELQDFNSNWTNDGKLGFEHYMLKEIYEQKHVIQKTVSIFKTEFDKYWKLKISKEDLNKIKKFNFIAAGTSWHAGYIGKFFFEYICKMPTDVSLASEWKHLTLFDDINTLHILISQSGETADTLEALRLLKSSNKQIKTLAVSNVNNSSIMRESEGSILMAAGPEISVASTKAFTAQIANLYLLAHYFAFSKNIISETELEKACQDLIIASEILEDSIEKYKYDITNNHAKFYSKYTKAIFLGRHISYPFCREAALKLKELAYIFTDAYPAGELKHGSIALVDNQTPVFVFSVLDPIIYQKIVSNAQEVKARFGHLVIFAFEGQDELISLADTIFIFPKVAPLLSPLVMTGLMQFLVYKIAHTLKREIDRPRNLAKSVTVE